MKPIIDTHIHVWDLEKAAYPWLEHDTSILHRTYAITELESERKKAGVVKGVLVQAAGNFEDTDGMIKAAKETGWIAGVVGWLPLQHPEAAHKAYTEKYSKEKYFKGVRHQVHDEADPEWLLQPEVLESLAMLAEYDLPYDIVGIHPVHIRMALRVAEKVPQLRMVFDHLNQPPIRSKELFGEWGALMKEAAQHPRFYAKISGLGTTAGNEWSVNGIQPYIEYAIGLFGEDRCFCGGDWPVALLADDYASTWATYREVFSNILSEAAQDKIFQANASTFYAL